MPGSAPAHYRDKEDLLISLFLGMIDHFERIGLAEEPAAVLPGARQLMRHFNEALARALGDLPRRRLRDGREIAHLNPYETDCRPTAIRRPPWSPRSRPEGSRPW